jgi:hypothetical protein
VVASRDLAPSSFAAACAPQTFGVPFVQTAALGPLELRVRWLAASNAPEVVVSDVSIDGDESFAAASLEHECGSLDATEELVSDGHHEPNECVLGRAPGVALTAGPQHARFELGLDDFWNRDAAIAELSVIATGGAAVATRMLQRSDFGDGVLHAVNVDFNAQAGARYDFVVKRLAPADAPRLRLRAIYVRHAAAEQPLTLPFDVRAVGNAAADGDADGSGTAFAADGLARLAWPNATFKLGPLSEPGSNALTSAGQALALTLPPNATAASALHVLLLAAGGAQPDNVFAVDYAQGAPQTFTRSLSDWLSPELAADEHLAVRAPFVWTKTAKSYGAWHVSELTLPLDPTRAPTQLTLPKNAHLKILAITLSE